jgi:hypothetical protein
MSAGLLRGERSPELRRRIAVGVGRLAAMPLGVRSDFAVDDYDSKRVKCPLMSV